MILHYFELPKYDWKVYAYYGVTPKYKDIILELLHLMGCKQEYIEESLDIIGKKNPNTGFTYTNYFTKQSIIAISDCDSREDFINTLVHEARHLQLHIQDEYQLSDYTEEIYYLIGSITLIMYNKSKPLLEFM